MTDVVIELNPAVRDMIEAAIKAAQPIWLGIVDTDKNEICARRQMLLNADGLHYFNAEPMTFGPVEKGCNVDGVCLAKTKTSVPKQYWRCNTISGRPPPAWLHHGDSLSFAIGSVRMDAEILDNFAE